MNFFQNLFVKQITKKFIAECVGKPNPHILEIGCNDGTNTLWFLEIFDNPKIYCFEPEPRAIKRFKEKVGDRANVSLSEMAIGASNGEITFYQSGGENPRNRRHEAEGWDQSGSIRKPKEHLKVHPWVTFDRQIQVPMMSLDSWYEERQIQEIIDFIWMDVQGAEADVIDGGLTTLAKTRFIYTEYNNRELYDNQLNLDRLLAKLPNFEVVRRYPDDVLLKNKKLATPGN
jgi:2-O-methyltransferase